MGAKNLLTNLTPKGRIALAATAFGTLIAIVLLVQIASRPSYSIMLTGLDPAETGEITATLDEKGIKYELQNNGTAVAVEKSQTADARIALASAGHGTGSQHEGFELVTKQKLGASNFQQKVAYQQALQGELAKNIEQIKGVGGAQVTLVIPEEQIFAEEQQQGTASVLLTGEAGDLEPGAVRGIAQLVASSVKGLKHSSVTITDGTGALLWPNGESGTSPSAGTKQAAEARYSQQLQNQLDAMLLRTLGPGKAQVQVNSTLDVNDVSKSELKHSKNGTPVKSHTETETLTGGAAGGAGGAAGTGGNIPTLAQTGAGAGGQEYERESEETEVAVDKVVTKTKVAPGTVEKVNVALVIDKSVAPETVAGLKTAVASAAGIDTERGDTLAVTQVAFAKLPKPESATAAATPAAMIGYAKWVLLAIGTMLFMFFVSRHLKKRETEALVAGEPVWLREIEAPRSLAELEGGGPRSLDRGEVQMPVPKDDTARRQLEHLVEREPERVAAQVRSWMQDD